MADTIRIALRAVKTQKKSLMKPTLLYVHQDIVGNTVYLKMREFTSRAYITVKLKCLHHKTKYMSLLQ